MSADDDVVAEVAAMQFAGGMSIAEVIAAWERDQAWVEAAIRRAMLESIPQRDGGLKSSRAHISAAEAAERAADREAQAEFYW